MEATTETHPAKIAEYSKTEAGLADLRSRFAGAAYEVGTPAGMKLALAARAELRTLRVDLEKMRQAIKAPLLERTRALDAEAKRITAEIAALEDPIDAQIKGEEERREKAKQAREAAERQRLAAVTASIEAIRRRPLSFVGKSREDLMAEAGKLGGIDLAAVYDETHRPAAQAAVVEAVAALSSMAEARGREDEERERVAKERAELERWKADQEAALAEERKRAAAERAEADRLAALERDRRAAEQRRLDERAAAERAEADRVARVERERLDAEARSRTEAARRDEEAARAERERVEAEARQVEARRRAEEEAEEARRRELRDAEERTAIASATLLDAAKVALGLMRQEGLAGLFEYEMLRAAVERAES